MSEQEAAKAKSEAAKNILEEILKQMGYEGKVELFDQGEGNFLLHIESADAARLIGKNAQVLDALQFVVNRMVGRRDEEPFHCTVDIERYRERRKDRLLKEAYDAAERVRRNGRPFRLAPMSAGDRRIVHQALKDDPEVETYSEETGERGEKKVVVCRKGEAGGPRPEAGRQTAEDGRLREDASAFAKASADKSASQGGQQAEDGRQTTEDSGQRPSSSSEEDDSFGNR